MLDGLGWIATAIFALSYLVKTTKVMRRVQAVTLSQRTHGS